jgi:hypothetical protein
MRAPFCNRICCVICGSNVPEERMKKRAITCSPACGKERSNMLRRLLDSRFCRYCSRPATPEEQARFRRWRAWERKNPPTEAEIEVSEHPPVEEAIQ